MRVKVTCFVNIPDISEEDIECDVVCAMQDIISAFPGPHYMSYVLKHLSLTWEKTKVPAKEPE